jgi:cytochrome c5
VKKSVLVVLTRTVVLCLVAVCVSVSLVSQLRLKADGAPSGKPKAPEAGKKIYDTSCSACHPGGSNIINPKKLLKGSNRLASKAVFKAYLVKPTASMPPFPKIAEKDADLTALFDYARTLK